MELVVFAIAGSAALVAALGLVLAKNPVHGALMLVMCLFAVAVLFLNQDAQFLAAVQVIVYAGAIVVLFLFVIMLLGVDASEDLSIDPIANQRTIAAVIGLALAALLIVMSAGYDGEGPSASATNVVKVDSITTTGQSATSLLGDDQTDGTEAIPNIDQLGRSLFTDHVLAFEVTALLLTIAVVGAVMLARYPRTGLAPIPVGRRFEEPDEGPESEGVL